MTVAPGARRVLRAEALAVGVWLVLVALFAMHGLPMHQPGAMAGMAAAAPSHPATHAAAAPGGVATLTATTAGCGAGDHCLATTHDGPQLALPALVGVTAADGTTRSSGVHPDAHRQQAPPPAPPDLDELSISRT